MIFLRQIAQIAILVIFLRQIAQTAISCQFPKGPPLPFFHFLGFCANRANCNFCQFPNGPPFHFLRFCANCNFSDFLKAIFEGEMDLRNLRILVKCANRANCNFSDFLKAIHG